MRIVILSVLFAFAAAPALAQPTVEVPQGDIGRWAGGDATACEFEGKRRTAIEGDCYYPIDFARAPGRYPVAKITADGRTRGTLVVTATEFPEQPIDLPEELMHYVTPGPAELARIRRESEQVKALFYRNSGEPRFTLPLGAPHEPLPTGKGFGYKRIFNGHPKAPHTGLDYGIGEGQPVNAVADGVVVLTGDHFFSGQAVYVNHGDRLVSEYFHLSDIAVEPGQAVKKGELLGKVGGTGRSTGPHLHFGVRWHGMRVDPSRLLGSPSALPQVK